MDSTEKAEDHGLLLGDLEQDLRRFADATGRDPRVVRVVYDQGANASKSQDPSVRNAAGWATLRREYPKDWRKWTAAWKARADEARALAEARAKGPWSGRQGWEEEPPLPIHLIPRKDRPEPEPVEPAYVLYNELVTAHHFRPFRTSSGGPRIAVPGRHGLETYDPTEEGFQKAIGYDLFTLRGEPVPRVKLGLAIEALVGRARSRALPRERIVRLALRVASEGPVSRLDLVDDCRRCVSISADGWNIETIRHPTFDQRLSMKPLPEPIASSDPDGWKRFERLWRFISLAPKNGADDPALLATALLIHFLLAPTSPKPIGLFGGEEGNGKSTAAARFQSVVDPATPRIVGASTLEDPKELINLLMNHAVVNVDNVSNISPALSDDLARLSTGIGFAKRELFTDSGEVVGEVCPLVLINGITATPYAPDLLRRIAFFPVAAPVRPVPIEQLDREWESEHPAILGGLLDLAVRTARVLRDDPPPLLPSSMADHVRIGQAVAAAMGRPREDFVAAWAFNVDRQGAAAAENPWVSVLADFFGLRSPSSEAVRADGIAEWITANAKGSFPKGVSPTQVGHQILRVKKTLARMGILVGKRSVHNRTLYFRLAEEEVRQGPALDDSAAQWAREVQSDPTHPTHPTLSADSLTENPEGGVRKSQGGVSDDPTLQQGGVSANPTPTPPQTPPSAFTSEETPEGGVGWGISKNRGKGPEYSTTAGRELPEETDLRETRADRARREWRDLHPEEHGQ